MVLRRPVRCAISGALLAICSQSLHAEDSRGVRVVAVGGEDLGIELVPIPAGDFIMGSPTNEKERKDDESQHRVKVSQPFWMGATEVTIGQFKAFLEATRKDEGVKWVDEGCPLLRTGNAYQLVGHRFSESDKQPMVLVNWNGATAFCQWLTERERKANRLPEGYEYRLPTEAQWEYSCRAGSTTTYCFGDDPAKLGEYAWYGQNADVKSHPVAGKKANAWGLYDMHGNVWEWCYDRHGEYPSGNVTDPVGATTDLLDSFRVFRGGGWYDSARGCRAACRSRYLPRGGFSNLGFRLALSPVQR